MSSKSLIIPTGGATTEVRALASLTTDQLAALERALSDRSTVVSPDYIVVAEKLGIDRDTARDALSAIKNIRRQRERFGLSEEDLIRDLLSFFNGNATRTAALVQVLRKSDEDYFVEKATGLRHAIGAHYVEAKTVVDLRPIFSRDRSAVEGMLAVTYLEIRTHDITADDEYACHTIQLSKRNVAELKRLLADAEVKLQHLEERFDDVGIYE